MQLTLFRPLFLISVFICSTLDALRISGIWRTNEFFYFLSKFGFQKTNQHEIDLSEGYIFGNISLSKTMKNVSALPSFTLVLLPRQFFVDFYSNRSYEDYDLACKRMFKEIDKEAYDAKCHYEGREDFLRHIPCSHNKLCIDEDNPKNVIPGMQLTYAVQDVNNPRFWYLSMVACRRNKLCQWEHSKDVLEVAYDLTLVNGQPFVSRKDPFEYHFSFDRQGTVEIYLVCLVLYSCILVPIQVYAVFKQIHPITRLFTVTLACHLTGLILDSIHLLIMSFNGIGIEALNILGDMFNIVAQSLFMILLLLLARGWAVTRMQLTRKQLILILWSSYSFLIFILYFWNMTEIDVIEDIDKYQTWPGWFTLILRIIIMFWFLYELRNTMTFEHNAAKLQFFLQFGAASLVWFIYLPVVAMISLQISHLWRYKILLGFTFCADFFAHSFMAYILWPQRSEQYLLLANEVDLSEELEAFNEAPHILNDVSQMKSTSVRSDLSSTESLVNVA